MQPVTANVESIFTALVGQVPDLVAIIFVVIIFVRSQEKRDAAWQSALTALTSQIQTMENLLSAHVASRAGADEILIQLGRKLTTARAKLK